MLGGLLGAEYHIQHPKSAQSSLAWIGIILKTPAVALRAVVVVALCPPVFFNSVVVGTIERIVVRVVAYVGELCVAHSASSPVEAVWMLA